MAQKHYLHELLQEDQEPFQLKKYIADRRCQLKTIQLLQLKKRKPISSNFCFFSFHDSPDPRKSPLFELPSPHKTPSATPNRFFLHIPAKTSALLLEASLRIQKQSSKHKSKSRSKNKTKNNASVGLFGSIRRRLVTHRKRESSGDVRVNKLSVKDILRNNDHERVKEEMVPLELEEKKSAFEISFSCSYNGNGRPSSAVWSESNEDNKSLDLDLDLETSCSGQSEDFEEDIQFASCESESPFRFVLQKTPSTGSRTPDFTSPATSPSRHIKEDEENHHQEIEVLKKFQLVAEEEEEEKEQCSPVSVLDTPFEDDDEGHVDEDEDGFDLECSYAIVQRAKQQLLHKLRRFEKLAELDPIELEKRMLDQDHDDNENDVYDIEEEEECEDYESASSDTENSFDGSVKQVLSKSSFNHVQRIPQDMKRLVTDLIAEEEREQNWSVDGEVIVKRVCRRLDSWKEVVSNTIDMMVEQDIRKELDGWKRNQEQVGETAIEIELAIFGLLMEELLEELVASTGN